MNWITILGKAYKKGSLAEGKNGIKYQSLNLMDRSTNKEATFYFPCVAFGKTAEYIDRYVEPGDEVVVFGEVKENKKDKKLEVVHKSVTRTSYPGNKHDDSQPDFNTSDSSEDIF